MNKITPLSQALAVCSLKFVLALVGATMVVSQVQADDPDVVAHISCEPDSGLQIRLDREEVHPNAPYPRAIKAGDTSISMRGLMWATATPNGKVSWHHKSVHRTCHLSSGTYQIYLSGHKEVTQGMCSGGSPTLMLSVLRNQQPVTEALVFDMSCFDRGEISLMRFPSSGTDAEFLVRPKLDSEWRLVQVPIDALITRKHLFAHE